MPNPPEDLFRAIARICTSDRRYGPESYLFTLAALHYTVAALPEPRHVTGPELLTGIRQYALDQFGPMAQTVFEHWGVRTTEDFGHIVFSLVDHKVLSKTEQDNLADFRGVYEFTQAFSPAAVTYTLADDLPELPAATN